MTLLSIRVGEHIALPLVSIAVQKRLDLRPLLHRSNELVKSRVLGQSLSTIFRERLVMEELLNVSSPQTS